MDIWLWFIASSIGALWSGVVTRIVWDINAIGSRRELLLSAIASQIGAFTCVGIVATVLTLRRVVAS